MKQINNYILEKLRIDKDYFNEEQYYDTLINAIQKMINKASISILGPKDELNSNDYTITKEECGDVNVDMMLVIKFKLYLNGQERYEFGKYISDELDKIKDGHKYKVTTVRTINIMIKL